MTKNETQKINKAINLILKDDDNIEDALIVLCKLVNRSHPKLTKKKDIITKSIDDISDSC